MKAYVQAFFYLVIFLWIVAFVKMILVYIHWDAETIFTAGCVLLTFGFIPGTAFSYRARIKKNLPWILVIAITLSILAFLSGTKSAFNSFLPNFWIGIILQAFALGILSLVTTEKRTIILIWCTWLAFSIVLLTIHLLNGTL